MSGVATSQVAIPARVRGLVFLGRGGAVRPNACKSMNINLLSAPPAHMNDAVPAPFSVGPEDAIVRVGPHNFDFEEREKGAIRQLHPTERIAVSSKFVIMISAIPATSRRFAAPYNGAFPRHVACVPEFSVEHKHYHESAA